MLFPVASFPSWSQQMISNYFVKINVIDGTGWEVTYISSSWYILALQKCFIYTTAIWRHSLFFSNMSIWKARNNLICIFLRIKLEHFLSCVHQQFYIHQKLSVPRLCQKGPFKGNYNFQVSGHLRVLPIPSQTEAFSKGSASSSLKGIIREAHCFTFMLF